jgi:hypothetical protein
MRPFEGLRVVDLMETVTPNHALHRTLHPRRFACWFRAGEGSRWTSGRAWLIWVAVPLANEVIR